MKKEIAVSGKNIYLDTSFILNSLADFYDKNHKLVAESQSVLWLLVFESWKYFISNITINEIFNVVEKQWFRAFLDNKIIDILWKTKDEWKSLSKDERNKFRILNDNSLWFDINNIKYWRREEFKKEYKNYVYNEFENIIDSLFSIWDIVILSNLSNPQSYYKDFLVNIKKFKTLDSNDLNHFLFCKENFIDWIITCDSDFLNLSSEIDIILVN